MIRKLVMAGKAIIRRGLLALGYKIVRAGGAADRGSMEGAFRALQARKHAFNTVIDIGASNGSWSDRLMRYFPSCQYLLIEAQPVHERALRDYCARHDNAQFVLAAAGEQAGNIFF